MCSCDCECKKEADREGEQCDDCDDAIHYDNIRKVYVDYETNEVILGHD